MSNVLKEEERVLLALRELYSRYGYLPYKMSKFEAYDLYVENKEFLVGDGVITFTDTDGKLLALKPDVTLSIIKKDTDEEGKRKVYYNENVYRISAKTGQFKEIMQVGLECLGDIDTYDVYETVCLAAESLASISQSFVLSLSHLGVLSALLKEIGGSEKFVKKVTGAIAEKNGHEVARLCDEEGVCEEGKQKILTLVNAYGDMQTVLKKIAPLCQNGEAKGAFFSLQALCDLLKNSRHAQNIRLDFSVGGNMRYYNDVVFNGFVDGVAEKVLSGGRYDKLLSRMGRKSGAIGFAVYLDLLEGFGENKPAADVDVLVLYDERTATENLVSEVEKLVASGKSVRAQKQTGGVRYKELVDLTGGKI